MGCHQELWSRCNNLIKNIPHRSVQQLGFELIAYVVRLPAKISITVFKLKKNFVVYIYVK